MQHRGMQVVDVNRVFRDIPTDLIGGTVKGWGEGVSNSKSPSKNPQDTADHHGLALHFIVFKSIHIRFSYEGHVPIGRATCNAACPPKRSRSRFTLASPARMFFGGVEGGTLLTSAVSFEASLWARNGRTGQYVRVPILDWPPRLFLARDFLHQAEAQGFE